MFESYPFFAGIILEINKEHFKYKQIKGSIKTETKNRDRSRDRENKT